MVIGRKIAKVLTTKKVHPKLDPKDIRMILIAGSTARGLEKPGSDVDIVVVTDKTRIDKQEFRRHLAKHVPEAMTNCVFVYDYDEFLKSFENHLTDGSITKKRLKILFVKGGSRLMGRIVGSKVHRKLSVFLRQMGLVRNDPKKYSLEEQISMIPIYERDPGEWQRLISGYRVPEVFETNGARRIVYMYISGDLDRREARKQLSKLPTLWKKDIKRAMGSWDLTGEEKKKIRKLLRGPY